MHGSKTMCFDAALSAAHSRSGFSNVHIFPVTHEKGFSLTYWKLLYFFFYYMQYLCPLGLRLCAFILFRIIGRVQTVK